MSRVRGRNPNKIRHRCLSVGFFSDSTNAPLCSWRRNWDRLSVYFAYAPEIRRVIYTTNIIEGFHRQLRKVTKTKGAFSSDEALMKLLYLVQEEITSTWKRPIHNWNQTLSQLSQ